MQLFPIKNVLTGEILQLSIDEWVKAKTETISETEATVLHKVGDKKFMFSYQPTPTEKAANPNAVTYNSQNAQPITTVKKCNCR